MKCIVALGNPGNKFKNTRHNVGVLILEEWIKSKQFLPLKEEEKFFGKITKVQRKKDVFLLATPTTYMNESGKCAAKIVSYYKILLENFLIIHDELDLQLSKFRFSFGRNSAGHNGVQSIFDALGTNEFHRLRVGIAPHDPELILFRRSDPSAFVLGKFTRGEKTTLEKYFSEIFFALDAWLDK